MRVALPHKNDGWARQALFSGGSRGRARSSARRKDAAAANQEIASCSHNKSQSYYLLTCNFRGSQVLVQPGITLVSTISTESDIWFTPGYEREKGRACLASAGDRSSTAHDRRVPVSARFKHVSAILLHHVYVRDCVWRGAHSAHPMGV